MDNKNDDKPESYINEVDESTVSNPFSNALKNILQKLHLIKSDQKLIGTKETNSRGYQTTMLDPLKATEDKSLKAILRNTFETLQQKRAEKVRAKNATNTLPKYTIGKQESLIEQNQTVFKEPTHEFIRPKTESEKAAIRAAMGTGNSAPIVENISVDKSVVKDLGKAKIEESAFDSDSSSDGTPADADIIKEPEKKATMPNVVVMAEMTVNGEPENEKDPKSKTAATKGKDEPDQREF